MLHLLDDSLTAFLRQVVPLRERDVDVVFDAPDRDWAAGVSRPTIDLYLWDVRPNAYERQLGLATVPMPNGRPQRQPALPRIDCRYLVTAWTSDVGDEHSLLGRVLAALMRHPVIAPEHLHGSLADLRPLPTVELRTGSGSENSDFWSALGGQLKPGLDVVVSATLDAVSGTEVGPPVDEVRLRERRRDGSGEGEVVVADAESANRLREPDHHER